MPHFPKPFYKQSRGTWYVQIGTKQHNLGSDEKAAFDRYYQLMQHQPRDGEPDVSLAVGVIDAFLDEIKRSATPRTFEWYLRHCQVFATSLPPLLTVGQLKHNHLTQCLAKLSHSASTKNGLCRAVMRAFQWAADEDLIVKSPLKGFKKPTAGRRELCITPEEFEALRTAIAREHFRDLVTAAWETGCRPQELTRVEKRHVDLTHGRWVFPAKESKGKKYPRIIYLNERALALTKKLCEQWPVGPLFRNEDGRP